MNANPVIKPTGLVYGHSEVRFLDESIPVLTRVLALDLIERRDHEAVLKHPNTGWKLIVHEGGADVKDKPERNHYGVRVSNNDEVDHAYQAKRLPDIKLETMREFVARQDWSAPPTGTS